MTQYNEEELNLKKNFKKTVIKTKFPSRFVKNDFDQEMVFKLSDPGEINLKCTSKIAQTTYNNSQLKERRIEEKRVYELENCKLNSYLKDINQTTEKPSEFEREIERLSLFGQKSKGIINVNFLALRKRDHAEFESNRDSKIIEEPKQPMDPEDSKILKNIDTFAISNSHIF